MANLEFQALLGHLGRDVSSMGFKIKEDVDKCLADLDKTHDAQIFCRNLVDILNNISVCTIQYAKKLEERIKAAGKVSEYNDAIKVLLQLTCKEDNNVNNSSMKRGPANNSLSLDSCVGSSGDKLKNQNTTTGLDVDFALSQCSSVHLGDELKQENEAQLESEASDGKEHVTVESSSESSSNESSSTICYELPDGGNIDKANSSLDDNITDLLEESHSEEVDTGESHDVTNNPKSTGDSSGEDEIFDRDTVANSPPNFEDVDQVADALRLQLDDKDNAAPAPVPVPNSPPNFEDVDQVADTLRLQLDDKDNAALAPVPVPSSSGEKSNVDSSAVSPSVDGATSHNANSFTSDSGDSAIMDSLVPQRSVVKIEDAATSRSPPSTVAAASRFDESDSDVERVADISIAQSRGDLKPAAINGKYSSIDESDDSDVEFVTSTSSPNLATSPHVENTVATSQQSSGKTDDNETEPNSSSQTSAYVDADDSSLGGDSDATVADLAAPQDDGSDSNDTVVNERSSDQAALPDQEEDDEDTDFSQVFSLRGSKEGISDAVAGDSDSDPNLDVPTQANETTATGENQGNNVGSRSDSDDDFDCPTQEANVVQEPEVNSGSTERNTESTAKSDTVASDPDSEVDFGAATQVSSGQKKSQSSEASKTTDSPEIVTQTNPEHTWNSQVDYDQPTQIIVSRPDKNHSVADSGAPNVPPAGDGTNGDLIGSAGPQAEEAAPEIEQLHDAAMDNDGDVSESESEPSCTDSAQSQSKKKLKSKEKRALLKLISEFYAKRNIQKEVRQDNGESSDAKKPTAKRKRIAKPKESRNKNEEASTGAKKVKKKRTPVKKTRTKSSHSRIDESRSGSSTEFQRDDMQIHEVSSSTSDDDAKQVADRRKKIKSSPKKIVDYDSDDSDTNKNKNDGTDPTINADAVNSGQPTTDTCTVTNAPKYPNDDDLEATQRADIRALRLVSADTTKRPLLAEGPREEAQPHDHSEAANSDQSVQDSEVIFKRKSIPPLPSSQSDSDQEMSASPSTDDTQVVRSFKKKTVLPLPSTQSDVDVAQSGDESEDIISTVNPFKRKAVLPIRSSSQSEETDTPGGPEDVQDKERAAKRLHSSGESDSEPPKKVSGPRWEDDDGCSTKRPEADSEDSAEAQPHPKRRKTDATASEDSSDPFHLDDTARDDFLEMLDQHAKDNASPEAGESNSDPEVEVPASQFKLDDSGRDNLLNLLTDKERDQHTAELASESERDAEPSQFKMDNAERDEFLELLNGIQNDTDDSSDDDDLEIIRDSDDIDRSTDDEHPNKPDKDTKTLKLDDDERNELLNLLTHHLQNGQIDGSDTDGSEPSLDSVVAGAGTDDKDRVKKLREVNREELLELVNEYEEAISKRQEVSTSDKIDVKTNSIGNKESLTMAMDISGMESPQNYDFHSDEDILREEPIVERSQSKKRKPGRPKDHSKEAWEAYQSLLRDDDDISSDTSSAASDVDLADLDELESDFSEQERRTATEARNAELRRRFGIRKDLVVDLAEIDISRCELGTLRPRQKGPKNDDRLCNLSNIGSKRATTKRRPKQKRNRSNSASSLGSRSDASPSSGSDLDEKSLVANRDSCSDDDSTRHALSDDEERERMANALWDNIKNSSDDQSEWGSSSLADSSDERSKAAKKRRKKAKAGRGGGKKTSSSEGSRSEDDDGAGSDDKDEKPRNSKGADLDSSDEDDFVGVRKGRSAWRRDPLLKSGLTSSDSDSSDSPRKRQRKRKEKQQGSESLMIDSDSDATTIDTEEMQSPAKKTFQSDKSDDSDFEIIEKQKTPQKIITLTDEEDTPSKRGKGRRNIRALVQDDDLAEATQRANNEEKERIRRLQERDKAKENFTQTQSVGSQQSEEDSEPLILDVHGDVQIKVHPKISRKLKPHQRDGIQFMWDSCYESLKQMEEGWEGSGCILAHCMGLGKTIQALGLIQTLFSHPVTKTEHVLVVCPLSTVSNWRNEYYLAYKGIKPCQVRLYTIENIRVAARRFDIVEKWWRTGGMLVLSYECFGLLVNDDKLKKMEEQGVCQKETVLKYLVNPGPDLVICDEGHLLRNKQTQRTLALNRVNTKRRIVLTGTPLQNNLLEYYYMVHFVKPNLLGTEKEFKTNFINPINNGQFEDSKDEDIMIMKKRTHVLHKKLNKTVQRVEDTELKQYLPKLVDQAVFVKLSDLQVNLYNTYLDSLESRPVIYTKVGNIRHQHFLADVQILRYICAHPDVVTTAEKTSKSKIKEQDVIEDNLEDGVEEKVFSKDGWYKNLLSSEGSKKLELGSKLMVALSIVEEATAYGDKVLIFAQSYAEMDNLELFLSQQFKYKKGHDYYRMDGTSSPELRTRMCDKFNRNDNKTVKVFIMSTKVGGLGLNLTAANRVILMNVSWNPSYDTQSVFRTFRFGQTKAVYVYRLIAIDTMEEKMYQRVVTKLAVAHRVVDKHQITRHYSAGDIQEFYSVRPTIGGDRPVPNVPEDRILAKLVQKHQFLWQWHEHQALLANRPEEDLDEQQKNAAWEEFNKQPADPPIPAAVNPHLITASALLAQAGPSGLQNRINATLNPVGRLQNQPRQPTINSIFRLQALRADPVPVRPPAVANFNNLWNFNRYVLKQTPSGPKFVFRTGHAQVRHPVPVPTPTDGQWLTAYGRTNAGTIAEKANIIRDVNTLIREQTTGQLVPPLNSAGGSSNRGRLSGVDVLNSIINESLSQHEDSASEDWAADGMNATLASLDLPSTPRIED